MLLDNLHHKRPGKRRRESTWDRSGGPRDMVELGPAQSITVPELPGPGIIRHLWVVLGGERWPPTLHGTGTEDYFNLAYGVHRVDCRPEYGVTFLERPDPTLIACGKFSMYRFHLSDPIPFERSLAASLEHGNFNLARVHYRSVANWYGRPTDL